MANNSSLLPDPNQIGQTPPVSGNNPLRGFSKQYSPTGMENVYQNPWSILQDVFKGINTAGSGYQGLRNLNADPMSLYTMISGRGNALAGSDGGNATGDYVNWLASLYKTLGTVGGRGFSASELLNNIFNPQGGAQEGGSALENILKGGDANTQMRTLFNMAKDATNVGMNPLAARGYQAALSRAGDSAMNQVMHSDASTGAGNVPIYQLIKQIAPGLIPNY